MPVTDRVHSPTPEELMAYLDGEAQASVRAAIETHVGQCAECQNVIDDLRGVSSAVAQWKVADAPVTLRPPQVQRARGWVPPAFSWRPGYLAISFGAVAATAVLVSFVAPPSRLSKATPHAAAAEVDLPAVDGRVDRNGAPVGQRLPGGGAGGRPEPQSQLDAVQASPFTTEPARQGFVKDAQPTVSAKSVAPRQPSVIRTATLRLVASDFNSARASVESIVTQAGGFLDQMTVNGAPGSAQVLTGTLRVPADGLRDALAKLRQLGQVTEDTQGSEDVTDQLVDLEARLANARATEQRLNDILKNRTGKLSDVLEVEREVSRVRLEIEQMDAQRVNMGRRVAYATITLQIDEVRKAGLESGPLALSTRLHVAAADGLEAALESLVGAVLLVLRAGPATALWLAAAAVVWIAARRIKRPNAAR